MRPSLQAGAPGGSTAPPSFPFLYVSSVGAYPNGGERCVKPGLLIEAKCP